MTIQGNGFGTTANTLVTFTGPSGPFTVIPASVTSTQIQVSVPQNTVDGPVRATVENVASNPLPFDIAFTTAGAGARDVAIDNQDRIYYVPAIFNDRVIRLNQNGTGSTVVFDSGEEVTGIAVDRPARTTLYVITRGDPTYVGEFFIYHTGRIYSVNLTTGVSILRRVLPLPTYSDPGGIDVKLPYAYVGVDRPDVAMVILQINLDTGVITELLSRPFSDCIWSDVKLDDSNSIYSVIYEGTNSDCPPGPDWRLYKGTTLKAFSAAILNVDCLNRVRYTDLSGGYVCLLQDSGAFCDLPVAGPHGIDMDSKGNLFVGASSNIRRLTTAGSKITSCANDFRVSFSSLFPPDPAVPTRIYADFDPTCCDAPNVQFAQLKVCLSDTSIALGANDRVVWSWQDADDPSTDTTIDPNGNAGTDNYGWLDGSDSFTQEPGYPLVFQGGQYQTEYDASRCSAVRFHPTDAPGDNFTVTALANTKLGSNSVTSDITTVWKTLFVEVDSMGTVTGPLDYNGDDALIGDISAPTGSLLQNAFAPAYINVALVPSHYSANVAFKTHVPQSVASPESQQDEEIQAQGVLGRASVSAFGSWWAYMQSGYESYVEKDWDPNGEGEDDSAVIGAAWGPPLLGAPGKWGFVFQETIRDYCGSYASDETYCTEFATLHEIGHEFGLIHPDPANFPPIEVMDSLWSPVEWDDIPPPPPLYVPPPRFAPKELRVLRCRCGQATTCPPCGLIACSIGQNQCLAPSSKP